MGTYQEKVHSGLDWEWRNLVLAMDDMDQRLEEYGLSLAAEEGDVVSEMGSVKTFWWLSTGKQSACSHISNMVPGVRRVNHCDSANKQPTGQARIFQPHGYGYREMFQRERD